MEKTIQEIQAQLSQQLQFSSETASLDAQVLIAHCLGKPRAWVLAHPDFVVEGQKYQDVVSAAARLSAGESLPYVIGHWEFYGLDFRLTPDVLIPRTETELLVDRAISWLQENPHRRRVIDVGTGSGCIGISIAKKIPDVSMLLSDISAPALNIARQNIEKHGLAERIEVCNSDLLTKIPDPNMFDLICANLPYIPTEILDRLPVAKKEPRRALDGGGDGLEYIQKLLEQANNHLLAGGCILLEIDPSQSAQVSQYAKNYFPSAKVEILKDLSQRERCIEIKTRMMIYHLCKRDEWLIAQNIHQYQTISLMNEGFIHCSRKEQLIDVANRYYSGVADMVVLVIDPEKLIATIRWEISGEQYYPHVYGPINMEAVWSVVDLHADPDGIYRQFTG